MHDVRPNCEMKSQARSRRRDLLSWRRTLTRLPYRLASCAFLAGLISLPGRSEAAISVGPVPAGTGTLTFDATPAATEWSSATIAGGAGDITTTAALDAAAVTNSAANLTTALGTTSTQSPSISANALARHNTALKHLQTCPTGVAYTVLMATLKNESGVDLVGLEVSYDFGLAMPAGSTLVEEIPGHRVFYSQTGAPGSWTLASGLSTGTAGKLTATLDLGTWAKNALLYILWVDDNGSANRDNNATPGDEEGGYTIDNFLAVGVAPKPKIIAFQQGLNGYTGAVDTEIRGGSPDADRSTQTEFTVDSSDGGGEVHDLLRFENLFGTGANQIPPGKAILAVTLTLTLSDTGDDVEIHRLNKAWSATTTWNTFDPINLDGVLSGTAGSRTADDAEAVLTPEATFQAAANGELVINLPTATVQAWADGAPNYGWALVPTGSDGVDLASSKSPTESARPKLTVTWGEAGEPALKGLQHSPDGFAILIEDGKGAGAKQVDPKTIKVSLDGADVTAALAISKAGTVTTVKYTVSPLFLPVSKHVASIAFSDTSVPPRSQAQDYPFTVVSYATLTPDFAVNDADVVKSKPGFLWTIHQNGALTANSNQRALDQLGGKLIDSATGAPYDNMADPGFQGVAAAPAAAANPTWAPLKFEIPGVINLSQVAGEANGNFTNDLAMPGISSDLEGIAAEIYTYIELPAGVVNMGVNSDDGFRTTAGNARDALQGVLVGEFDAGRGAADTIFTFAVQKAGIYAFRTIWEEGTGGANIEWFTVKADGTKVLVNDTAKGGLAAYRAVSTPAQPYVKSVTPTPVPRMVNQPGTNLVIELADGANPVDVNSVKLTLDGKLLNPTVTRQGSTVTVTFTPTDLQIPGMLRTAKIEFKDSTGTYTRSQEWTFRNLKKVVLPAAKYLETFESTPEGQVPTGWVRQNFTTDDTAGVDDSTDFSNLHSDAYKDFLVVNRATVEPLKTVIFQVNPGQTVNGKEVTTDTLASGNILYAESDVRGGDQVQFVTTAPYDLSGFVNDAVLSFSSLYEQNQDSIGVVEYSIDDGKNWLPVTYYLDSVDGGGDIVYNPDGSVDAVTTLTRPNADTASWTDNGVRKGDTYGAFLLAPITAALGPYIEPRLNDDNNEGKRVEVYYLPGAAGQSKVRIRFAQGGTGSWYFGIDNLGLYDVKVAVAAPVVAPRFNAVTLQGGAMVISWTGTGTLQEADVVTGPWTNAAKQDNPQSVQPTGNKFYRLKQ